MKRNRKITWIILISLIACIALVIGSILIINYLNNKQENEKYILSNGTLIINGDTVVENVTLHYNKNYSSYLDVPLIKLFNGIGASVEWLDDTTAEIVYKGRKYNLNLSTVSLNEYGDEDNLIAPVDGGHREYTVLDKELILDSVTITCAFAKIKEPINFSYDFKKGVVYINP